MIGRCCSLSPADRPTFRDILQQLSIIDTLTKFAPTAASAVKMDDDEITEKNMEQLGVLSGSKSPTNVLDIYRKKYPELAPSILNPNLTTANPNQKPSTSGGHANVNHNNPTKVSSEISELKYLLN